MKKTYTILTATFCVCLVLSNILETKQIGVTPHFDITGGLLVFPISYIINDCVTEIYGFRAARDMIWLGFALAFFFVLMAWLTDLLPAAPYWDNAEGFHAIFGLTPRVTMASFLAFLLGSLVNAYSFQWMKEKTQGRRFALRSIASSVLGEILDSAIFFPLAFVGIIPPKALLVIACSQVVLKTLYEVVCLPLTKQTIKYIRRYEDK